MWGRESPVSRFIRKFPHFRPILDSTERRRVESSKCRALLWVCVDVFTGGWTELGWLAQTSPARPSRLLAWSQRKILDFCSEENQRQRRKHVRTVITLPIMMMIIRINKLWCQQRDKPNTEIKNFKELSLSLDNCMWFKPNINTGQRSKNLRGQLKVKLLLFLSVHGSNNDNQYNGSCSENQEM